MQHRSFAGLVRNVRVRVTVAIVIIGNFRYEENPSGHILESGKSNETEKTNKCRSDDGPVIHIP